MGGAKVRLGHEQYLSLGPLFDAGSPVTLSFLEPADEIDGEAIEELFVTYFVNEGDRQDFVLTPEGDLIEPEEWDAEQPWSVGVTTTRQELRRFDTHDEAAEFIGTLKDHEMGIYYLDGPESERGTDKYKSWTITIGDPDRDPSSEAITIYAANSHASDLFINRLLDLADQSIHVAAYAHTTNVADPDGPRGESI